MAPKKTDGQPFKFLSDDDYGLGALTIATELLHFPAWFKYAVLVMEEEIMPAKDSSTEKVYRPRYFDQIEILIWPIWETFTILSAGQLERRNAKANHTSEGIGWDRRNTHAWKFEKPTNGTWHRNGLT